MIRCAITSSEGFEGSAPERQERLLERAKGWVAEGVELIQLREKKLDVAEQCSFAEALVRLAEGTATRVLVNGRADVAIAAGAHGVHLTAAEGELRPAQVRAVFAGASRGKPVVSVSCHTLVEVERAAANGADYILFGPVFEKRLGSEVVNGGIGLERLREAIICAGGVAVLALGGVGPANFEAVLAAGAQGVAGIRLFARSRGR